MINMLLDRAFWDGVFLGGSAVAFIMLMLLQRDMEKITKDTKSKQRYDGPGDKNG